MGPNISVSRNDQGVESRTWRPPLRRGRKGRERGSPSSRVCVQLTCFPPSSPSLHVCCCLSSSSSSSVAAHSECPSIRGRFAGVFLPRPSVRPPPRRRSSCTSTSILYSSVVLVVVVAGGGGGSRKRRVEKPGERRRRGREGKNFLCGE